MEVDLTRRLLELHVLWRGKLAHIQSRAELHLLRVLRTARVVIGQHLKTSTGFKSIQKMGYGWVTISSFGDIISHSHTRCKHVNS